MKKKNKNINVFLGILVVVLIAFLAFIYFDKNEVSEEQPFYLSDGSICEDIIVENNFRFCDVEMGSNLTIHKLEFFNFDGRIIHSFRNLPNELNDIEIDEGIGVPLLKPETNELKKKVYLSVDPDFNGDEILAAIWLPGQVLSTAAYGVFKMEVINAFLGDYEGSDHPIKDCSDVDNSTAVVEFRRGESKITKTDNCIVIYAPNETELNKVSEKFVYTLLDIKSD